MFLTLLLFRSREQREQLNGYVLLAAFLGVAGTVFILTDAGS
jgi:drug/metabolite transporter (DMT)-like permease